MTKSFLKERSLLFAPMEGVTDAHYRETVQELYPEWDFVATDFLRVPSVGMFKEKHFIEHIGNNVYNSSLMDNTIFQILASERSLTLEHMPIINALNIDWLDINLGCPSKTVCKNKGGSYLLSDLKILQDIIRTIRSNFKGHFTAKIRVGYQDDSNFKNVLRLLEDEGVEAITIHARTRNELYKGVANWDYVKEAVKICSVPVIGNGDIWSTDDIERYYDYTGAHSVMIARGALKTPWLAKLYKNKQADSLEERAQFLKIYFDKLYNKTADLYDEERVRIKRLKAVARYIFEPYPEELGIKRSFLLSKSYEQMQSALSII